MTANEFQAYENIQLFNESVLGSAPTDAVPVLMANPDATWAPKQVVLDYKDNACYGAIIHYERSQPFESLRRAINSLYRDYELSTFANDPTMGIWRMENAGFAIQLSDSQDEDSYTAIYIRFVDSTTLATSLEELIETKPELSEFHLEELGEALCDTDSTDAVPPDGA